MIRLIRRSSEVVFILNHYMILKFPFSSPCVVNNHLKCPAFHLHFLSLWYLFKTCVFFHSPSFIMLNLSKSRLSVLYFQLLFFLPWWPSPTEKLCSYNASSQGLPWHTPSQVGHLVTQLHAGNFRACLPLLFQMPQKHLRCNSETISSESFTILILYFCWHGMTFLKPCFLFLGLSVLSKP